MYIGCGMSKWLHDGVCLDSVEECKELERIDFLGSRDVWKRIMEISTKQISWMWLIQLDQFRYTKVELTKWDGSSKFLK